MTTIEQTREEVVRLFAEKMAIAVPDAEADLLGSGLLDSSGLVDLLLLLEERFGVTLQLEDMEIDDFRSCQSIAAMVLARSRPSGDWSTQVGQVMPETA